MLPSDRRILTELASTFDSIHWTNAEVSHFLRLLASWCRGQEHLFDASN